jgi:hypothetical protein
MSEQEASSADVNAQQDVSDAEFERYFETEGDEGAESSEVDQEPVSEPQAKEEKVATKEQPSEPEKEDQHERNYKAAMHEERERRKELQRQVDEVRTKNQRLEETFQRVMYMREQQAQQPQQPSYEDDPLGTLRSKQENLENFLATQAQAYQQQQQQQMVQQQFIRRYEESAKAFMQDKPDFLDAYKYVAADLTKQYEAAGYPAEVVQRLLHEDEAAIVANAYNDGVNPAERIYNLARVRGYNTSQKVAGNSADQKMSQLEKGIKASKSLSTVSDKSPKGRMTLEDVASMSDKEFAALDWDTVLSQG